MNIDQYGRRISVEYFGSQDIQLELLIRDLFINNVRSVIEIGKRFSDAVRLRFRPDFFSRRAAFFSRARSLFSDSLSDSDDTFGLLTVDSSAESIVSGASKGIATKEQKIVAIGMTE